MRLLRERNDLPIVFLAARWALASEGYLADGERGKPAVLARPGEVPSGPDGNYLLFRESLAQTVKAIRATGRQVVLLGNVPEIGWHVPNKLLAHLHRGVSLPKAPTIEQVRRRQGRADSALAEMSLFSGVHFVPIATELCESTCRTHSDEGWSYYFDDDHFSARGAREIVTPLVLDSLDNLKASLGAR